MGVAQNPGIVLDSIKDAVMSLGFSAQAPRKTGSVNSSVVTLQTMGGWKEITRFLGEIRPIRLLEKFKTRLRDGEMDKQMEGRCDPLEIVRVVDEGEQWVSGIETSTHTYFCEGYGAHNSVAEHSVLLADWMLGVAPEHALWALLHDASEAYMVDVPRPLKHSMPDYLAAERQVMRAVCRRFQLPDAMPALVHEADQDIIADELVNMEYMPWHDKHSEPLGVTLRYWSPGEAKEAFLNMYDTLVSMREKEAA